MYCLCSFNVKRHSRKVVFQVRILAEAKEHLNLPIIDYGAQSIKDKRFAQALSLKGRFNIFWYNIETGEKQEYNPATDSQYRGPIRTPWRMMIESATTPSFPRYTLSEGFPFGIPYEI